MARRQGLDLNDAKRAELRWVRDHHPKPYMREKAAALLKVDEGMSPHAVALHGLHKPRDPDTLYSWIDRYESEGVEGLYIRAGRGRKPGFSPSVHE